MARNRYSSAALLLLACALLCCRPALAAAASDSPPNIVFILVDDQGYYDLGCYGATEVQTPRIDQMAREGTRFTDYYAAAPICSPSRAGLLTGCYPRRVGNEIWVHRADSRSGIHPDELTLAELLKSGGYATACIGKWHLGFREPFLPANQGFDHYFGLLHNLDPVEVVYFADQGGVPLLRNGDIVKRPADPAELTKLYTDEAIQFMEQNKERPFFLYLPHTMLHNPLGVSESFQGSSDWGEYGDAIQELDYHVGRIFDALKQLRIDDRTIVIYASDNGRGPGRSAEQPLRGHKLSTYEGGLRVPAIAWGPGLKLQAGEESAAVVRAMDWYPTLASFAGISIPEGRIIDGRDICPLLTGATSIVPAPESNNSLNAAVPLRRRWDPPGEWAPLITRNEYNDAFFYHGSHGELAAVRWQNWKLFLNPSLQLFDLDNDPGESTPVRNAEITRKLRGMAILFQDEMRRDARPAGDLSDASLVATSRPQPQDDERSAQDPPRRRRRDFGGPITLGPDDKQVFPEPPEGFNVQRDNIARGKLEMIEYDSKSVGTRRKMNVYTPPGYSPDNKYPVLYLLHGIGGDETEWQRFATPDVLLDNLIADGKAVPMIIVMPNGRAQKNDRAEGNVFESAPAFEAFERDLLEDIIPTIETRYGVQADREHRALAGLSMGGGQSLNFGLKHLDRFAWIGGFSSAPNTKMPEELVPDPAATSRQLKLLWLSCGNKDGLIRISQRTRAYLKEHDVPHVWNVDSLAHDATHWRNNLYHFVQHLFQDAPATD